MKILVVEDDELLADGLRVGLESAQYEIAVATEGTTGLKMARNEEYSLLILDVMLPGLDGWSLCEALRRVRCRVPILMLTARDSLEDRVKGLDIGADDYLAKPFEFPELLARVRALLRRDKVHRTRILHIADLEIDTGLRRVARAGYEVYLTKNEYLLLEALALREGTTLTRDYIQETVWQDEESFSNTVDVCIGQLRKKIDAGHEPKLIQTVHRIGYLLKRPNG